MQSIFNLTDYKVFSTRIYNYTSLVLALIIFTFLLAEIFVDLRSTTIEVLIPFTVASFALTLLSFKFPDYNPLRTGLIILLYLLIEINFLINVKIFHVIIYWFPVIPLVALILQGLRATKIWLIIILVSHIFNSYHLNQTVGNNYTITINRIPFFVAGIIFVVVILSAFLLLYALLGQAYHKMKLKSIELEELKTGIENKKNLLERYQRELLKLSKDEFFFSKGQEYLFNQVCRTASKTLGINRVSVWLLEDNDSCMLRKFLYKQDNGTDEILRLERKDFPGYFDAIDSKSVIMAVDAKENPATFEFKDSYLIPLGIFSMLDCPIIIDRKVTGVICCESLHEFREWQTEDALFIQSLADFIAISFKNERIKGLLSEIRRKNTELNGKNKEIEAINMELNSSNEKLTGINEYLEGAVKLRTQELESQNKQLTEYAFINSHLLRAPLSRILGLSNLITREVTSIKEIELVEALVNSSRELDLIIKRISDVLYEGNNLTREDVNSIIDKTLNRN